MSVFQRDGPPADPSRSEHRHVGHRHFWERAVLSRRQFIGAAAGATGVVLGADMWMPALASAHAGAVAPRPIPGGIQPFGPGTEVFHVFLPGRGAEPSTITDFHGSVGIANLRGMGTATDTRREKTTRLIYDIDTRFMKGVFIGTDGRRHRGAFQFI